MLRRCRRSSIQVQITAECGRRHGGRARARSAIADGARIQTRQTRLAQPLYRPWSEFSLREKPTGDDCGDCWSGPELGEAAAHLSPFGNRCRQNGPVPERRFWLPSSLVTHSTAVMDLSLSRVGGSDLPALGRVRPMGIAAPMKPSLPSFSPPDESSGSSRPLRFKKGVRSGAPLRCAQSGSSSLRSPSRSRHREEIGPRDQQRRTRL